MPEQRYIGYQTVLSECRQLGVGTRVAAAKSFATIAPKTRVYLSDALKH